MACGRVGACHCASKEEMRPACMSSRLTCGLAAAHPLIQTTSQFGFNPNFLSHLFLCLWPVFTTLLVFIHRLDSHVCHAPPRPGTLQLALFLVRGPRHIHKLGKILAEQLGGLTSGEMPTCHSESTLSAPSANATLPDETHPFRSTDKTPYRPSWRPTPWAPGKSLREKSNIPSSCPQS